MSKKLNLAKISARGGINLFWGTAISSIISSIGIIIIARLLSPSNYGLYAITLIAPNLIVIFRDLGIDQATIRFTAKYNSEKKNKEIKSVLISSILFEAIIGTLLFLITFLTADLIGIIFNRPEIIPLIQIVSVTILSDAFLKTAQAVFTGYEKMVYHSILLVLFAIFKTGIMSIFVFLGLGIYGAIIGYATSHIITGLVSLLLFYFIIYKKLDVQVLTKVQIFSQLRSMLKFGLPLSIVVILAGFIGQFYNFLIAIYSTDVLIGNYQVAINFATLVAIFVTPVTLTLFPAFSKIDSKKEPETLKTVFQYSVKIASLLIIPVTFAVIALSKPGVSTIFGEKYEFTPLYLTLFVIVHLFTAFGNLSVGILIKSQGKTKINLKLAIISFILGIFLSITLIPVFGIIGLLIAHLTAGIPSLIIGLWWIKKTYNATIYLQSSIKILVASGVAAIPTFLISIQTIFPNWLILIIGTIIYLLTYIIVAPLIGALNQSDIQNLKQMLTGLGPLTPPLKKLLYPLEKITNLFQH